MDGLVSRRKLLLGLSVSGFAYVVDSKLAFGSQVLAKTAETFQKSQAARFLADLPVFDGVFVIDLENVRPFAEDFGHFVHRIPLGVLKPAHAGDIQKIAKFCSEKKIRLTVRGTGGAAYGQTQIEKGIVIDTSTLKSLSWGANDSVILQPGLIWSEVLDFTRTRKRSVPVLPDTIVTSVGGKANVGGIGETSYNLGAMTDQILEFDLIQMNGDLHTCSPKVNADLFYAALGSMGQFGIMTRIVMKTMPAADVVISRQYIYNPGDFDFLKDLQIISEQEPQGAIGGHFIRSSNGKMFLFQLDVTSWGDPEPKWLSQISKRSPTATKQWNFFDYANRNTKGWLDGVASGAVLVPHPYLSFYLPYEKAKEMSEFILNNDLVNLGASRIMLVPLINRNFSATSFMLPKTDVTAHFRLYRIVRNGEGSTDHLKMLVNNSEVVVPKILELGGTVYLPFSPILNAKQLVQQFGEEKYNQLKNFKRTYDEGYLLNSEARVFLNP